MPRRVSCLIAAALLTWVGGCSSSNTVLGDAGADAFRPCVTDADCDDSLYCTGMETCAAGACRAGTPPCPAPRTCDEALDACSTCTVRDADADGVASVACGGSDCDDADPSRYPGHAEVCDTADHDEDCDPTTFGVRDGDGDGEPDAACCNTDGTTMHCGSDCDDTRASVSPRLVEICDGLDNDCDSAVDEGARLESWPDTDGDGFGDAAATPDIVCAVPSFRASTGGDCNDADPAVHPTQPEQCNAIDDDCDGIVDEGGDAACVAGLSGTTAGCFAGHCRVLGCASDAFDCNGDPTDGCEHLCTSSQDCGSCGRVCAAPFTMCLAGHCPGDFVTVTATMTLRDAETGAPIAGATITTIGLCPGGTTTTRADGTYDLPSLEFPPRWVRIQAPGYPTHVQYADGDAFGPILPASLVDAWAADPDAAAARAADRAIVVIDYAGPLEANHDAAVLGPANQAVGPDLLPSRGPGARQVYLGALPGRTDVGGDVTDGAGCTFSCGAVRRLWLEPGAVTLVHDGMSCNGFCI